MHIQDIFERHRTTFSFEFFPPANSDASEKLFANIAELEALKPSFVSKLLMALEAQNAV